MKEVEEEEKEEKKKEIKKRFDITWFQKVPVIWKIGGFLILFLKYQSISSGNISELYIWILAVIAVWYFIGSEGKFRSAGLLQPEEAEDLLEQEVERKKKSGQINRFAQVFYGPNNGLFYHEGLPVHYQIGVEIRQNNKREYKRGLVFADGDARGIATIQDNPGKLTGREVIPIVTPKIFKTLRKYDISFDKLLFGEK